MEMLTFQLDVTMLSGGKCMIKGMGKRRKKLGLTTKDSIAGYLFILPFIIGFLSFMLLPIIQSIQMVFNEVTLDTANNRFALEFTGLNNINRAFLVDVDFTRLMVESLIQMALMVPAIIIFSFFVALLLNQEFKGRMLVRSIFFLPVILSSGIIVGLEANNSLLHNVADMIREGNAARAQITGLLEEILINFGGVQALSGFMGYIFDIVNQLHVIAMASGIQIIIFLSGLQTIPGSVFEAASMEGATQWEIFWKITFPMLSPLILVNVVYSVVDFLIRTDNEVMEHIREAMGRLDYGFGSAMAWVYFSIVAVTLGIVTLIISKRIYYYD